MFLRDSYSWSFFLIIYRQSHLNVIGFVSFVGDKITFRISIRIYPIAVFVSSIGFLFGGNNTNIFKIYFYKAYRYNDTPFTSYLRALL